MIVVLSVAVGMILWVILWSLGAKSFDGGMLFLLVVLAAATVKIISGLLPGNQDAAEGPSDPAPFN